MAPSDFHSYLPVLLIFLLGFLVAGLFIVLASIFGPKKPTASKLDTYECGVPILGNARERFPVKFFLVAMIFLIFDVEVVFLFPWAVLLKHWKGSGEGLWALGTMLSFLLILGLGLVYQWKRGAMDFEN